MEFFKFFNREPSKNEAPSTKNQIFEDGKKLNRSNAQQSVITGDVTNSEITQYIQYIQEGFDSGPIVDEKINEGIEVIRKSRFFPEFDTAQASVVFSGRLERELAGGSDGVKSKAMAWCSRFLSNKDLDQAVECLKGAKQLGICTEIEIAEAFIHSKQGDTQTALRILANISTPLSNSASLMVVSNHEEAKAAIDWLETAGISVSDLDSDGKLYLLILCIQSQQWAVALSNLDSITDDDLHQTPAINHLAAMIHLVSAVPHELRTVVLYQVPFYAAAFPLAADKGAIEARRKAAHFFINATDGALGLNLCNAAKIFEEYELWLGLKDPSQSEQTKQRIIEKLRDSKSSLRLVRLGLQFGIKFDLELVEKEIERQIALNGGITQDAAIARFALAFTQKKPEDVANYIARHFDALAKHFDKKSMQVLQIEMLLKAGMPEKAKEYFDILLKEGLAEAEESNLRRIIDENNDCNPIEKCKEQFMKTDTLSDLMILVEELEANGELTDLCEYSERAFVRTRSLPDGERLATALSKAQEYERLVQFCRSNTELLLQSKSLHMLYCWALYYEGSLLESRTELSKQTDDDNPNYRALQVNLGIALGDWNSITAYVAKEYAEKEKRCAQELMGAAQLAHYLGSPYAKELTYAAAAKSNNNADILASAYFLASNAGWEICATVSQWLSKAAELSGDNGPLQKKSLKDILDMKPDWDNRVSETLQLLTRGDLPMFLAGESLNRSLIHMMLFPALANQTESDPRRREIIPAYSGNRHSTPLKTLGIVAMDSTVLITMSLLKLLDIALDACETIYIPHSTLRWLFEEKQKASFHQPSRIKDARRLQHLLAIGTIEKLIPNAVPDSELSAQVGDELALLIAEASKANEGDSINNAKCIVVRPYPVYRISSLMTETADLERYANMLSSCQAIVDKMRGKGHLTIEEAKKARDYLHIHEKQWPNQPKISDRAILYLDSLAITYFQHLGLLERMQAAGFRLMVSPKAISEANALTSYERISDQINDAIEQIRSAVNVRIASGKVKVGRRHIIAETEVQTISGSPTVELFALAKACEAILIDDRFLNQHGNCGEETENASLFSTIDLLDALVSIGAISIEDLYEHRTTLRRAGYVFISVRDSELLHHLNSAPTKADELIETAELKAIRENILCVRMGTWLQLPKEVPWLDSLLHTFIRVIKALWTEETDLPSIRARSNWILKQMDVRGWVHCLGNAVEEKNVQTIRSKYIILLLLPPTEASIETRTEYWKWIEEMVLEPIIMEDSDLYFEITEEYRKQFARLINMDLSKGGRNE